MVVHLVEIHGDTLRPCCGADDEQDHWTTLTDLATCRRCLEARRRGMVAGEPEISLVHYWRDGDVYPACGYRGPDDESSPTTSAVTCPRCVAAIEPRRPPTRAARRGAGSGAA